MRNPFTFLIHSVVSILRTLIGSFSWQQPTWLQHLYNFYRLRPFAYTAAIILIALLSYGAHFAINRPKPIDPEAITFHVVTPATTDYSEIPLRYATLSVVFSKSVAPIELVEKTTHSIVMEPTLEGTWTWASDQRLEFTPNKDWPIETHFKVKLDEPKALAPNVRLAEKKFEFDTAPFSGSFHSSEFYQDPEDPKNKLGVFEFHFSHPVDTMRFEQKIALTLTDATGKAFPSPQWDVRYDESKTKAYIRSTPLSIPENGGNLKLAIAAGTQSSLGGNDLVDAQTSTVSLPSLYSVRIDKAETTIVENDRFEPEQALVITFNDTLKDQEVAQSVTLWALPQQNPKLKPEEQSNPFSWSAATVDESILKLSKELKLNPKPTERAYATTHGFTFDAPAGTQLYLRIKRGLKSYGGFLLGENSISVLTVPN